MGYLIRMKSRKQYLAALEVLDLLPGTWHCRGSPECPVLSVTEAHLTALVKAGVVSASGKKAKARGKKTTAKKRRKEHPVKLKAFIYEAEEGGYWAKVPAVPGCVSQGETLEEVKANILDALEGCLEVREEMARQEAHVVEEMAV